MSYLGMVVPEDAACDMAYHLIVTNGWDGFNKKYFENSAASPSRPVNQRMVASLVLRMFQDKELREAVMKSAHRCYNSWEEEIAVSQPPTARKRVPNREKTPVTLTLELIPEDREIKKPPRKRRSTKEGA